VIGAGFGWIIDAIEERAPLTKILVLEPEPAFVGRMLARRDFRSLIEAGRLLVCAGPAFDGRAHAWRLYGRCISEPTVIIDPLIAVARPKATVLAARIAAQALRDATSNERARRKFAAPYLLNTLGNVPVLVGEPDARHLFNLCPGRPVVVAGAGPSLNRNLDELRPYRDRVVLVSADTALRPCLSAGLPPDFVVAVDPGAPNTRHLTGVPSCEGTTLVAEASLQRATFAAFAGRTYLYRVASHHPWPWLHEQGVDVAVLRAWGSVMITAFDLAVRMGAAPVIFIGADLAYTGGQPYCRGTVYEEDWAVRMSEGQVLDDIWRGAIAMHPVVTERHGTDEIATAPHLVQFRDALAHAARDASCRVVNATGQGILRGDRIEQLPLVTVLQHEPVHRLPALTRDRAGSHRDESLTQGLIGAVALARSGGGAAAAWAEVLADHDPPDPTLEARLDDVLGELAAWARAAQPVAEPGLVNA
jgi:hypothetical protein